MQGGQGRDQRDEKVDGKVGEIEIGARRAGEVLREAQALDLVDPETAALDRETAADAGNVMAADLATAHHVLTPDLGTAHHVLTAATGVRLVTAIHDHPAAIADEPVVPSDRWLDRGRGRRDVQWQERGAHTTGAPLDDSP